MKHNLISMIVVLGLFLTFGMACRLLKSKEIAENKQTTVNTTGSGAETDTEKSKPKQPRGIVSADDKTDFQVQAEDLVKAKKDAPSPITPPEKYKGKIIEVTGRVSYLYPEKEKTLAPRVQLKGGKPIIDDVSCEFDEENKAEINTLRKDQMVTLKGLVPDMWLLHPSLQHCIIVQAK